MCLHQQARSKFDTMDSNDEDEADEAEVETELKRRLEESRMASERKEKRKSR